MCPWFDSWRHHFTTRNSRFGFFVLYKFLSTISKLSTRPLKTNSTEEIITLLKADYTENQSQKTFRGDLQNIWHKKAHHF